MLAKTLSLQRKEIDMIGKLIGAVVGAKAAESARGGLGGAGGALVGAGTVALARRLGPIGLIAAAAGGYAFKKYRDRKQADAAPKPKARATA
jgi:hypothetical protein